MMFEVGTEVGAYRIVEKLGKGGMATVYKGYHARLDRYVAIKVLHAAFKEDDSFLRRFTREAQVVARLEHSNIVTVYDYAEQQGHPYLVMRYIAGETLKERISRTPLRLAQTLEIAAAIGSGLDYAHEQGVLHRDVKPSNILISEQGHVYIADFGLARIVQAGESTMSQEMIMGTPQYISPEQAKGEDDLDARTDVYSFGIVLYEMITGQVPFKSDTSYAVIHSQIFDPPPKPSSINQDVNPKMEEVLLKALHKSPAERYQSAGELVTAFTAAAGSQPAEQDTADTGPGRVDEPEITAPVVAPPAPLTNHSPPLRPQRIQEDARKPEVASGEPAPTSHGSWLPKAGITAVLIIAVFLLLSLLRGIRQQRSANQPADDRPAGVVDVATDSTTAVVEEPPELTLELPQEIRPVSELERLLNANPADSQLRFELALAYLDNDRDGDARTLIGDALKQTRRAVGFAAVAERLMETDRAGLAVMVLQEGLARFENDAGLQQMLMMAMLLDQTPMRLVQSYVDQLSQQPRGAAQITIKVGEAYLAFQRRNLDGALSIINSTLEIENNPYLNDLYFLQGLTYLEMGKNGEALTAFEAASASRPSRWMSLRIAKIVQEQELE